MSDYGFEVKNAAGQVVADATYPVYALQSSGSFTVGGPTQFSQTVVPLNIDLNTMPTMLLNIQVGRAAVCFRGFTVSGTTITGATFHAYSTSPFSVDYIVAVPASVAPITSGEYGIAVYDQNSKLTFHTGQRLVYVRQISTITEGATITHPALLGTRYIGMTSITGAKQTGIYYRIDPYGQIIWYAGQDWLAGISSTSSTSLSGAWSLFADNTVSRDSFTAYPPAQIVICELGA